MNCDVLVFAPHPDDAEILVGGSIARHVRLGHRVVVVDATRGELGSRGDRATRDAEAAAAAAALGIAARENLDLPDGHLRAGDLDQRAAFIAAIRRHRPRCIWGVHRASRHPDHRAAHDLLADALKAAALHKLPAPGDHPAHKVTRLWLYEGELPMQVDCIVPLSEEDWAVKRRALACYASQFHRGDAETSDLPATSIATSAFQDWIDHKGRLWGYHAEAPYGEAFAAAELPRLGDLVGI